MDSIVTITNKFGNKFKVSQKKADEIFLKGIIRQEDISEVETLREKSNVKFGKQVPPNKKNYFLIKFICNLRRFQTNLVKSLQFHYSGLKICN